MRIMSNNKYCYSKQLWRIHPIGKYSTDLSDPYPVKSIGNGFHIGDYYCIYCDGTVYSCKKSYAVKQLKPTVNKDGFLVFNIINHGKPETHILHRDIAKIYHKDYYEGCRIKFIDGDKSNCSVENLKII